MVPELQERDMARDSKYATAVEAASARSAKRGRIKAAAGGLLIALVMGAFLFSWLTASNASGVGLLLFGGVVAGAVFVFLIGPALSQGEGVRTLLKLDPLGWFMSPSHGLVVVADTGVFLERGTTRYIRFDSFDAQFICGAAYMEETHRLRLQLMVRNLST